MELQLSYRESQFSPAETAAITGLSLTMQRDWRSRGFLRARITGHASFSPRELAELRLMVLLRGLGVSLPEARKAAEAAAPSILVVALTEHANCVAVDSPDERGARYRDAIVQADDWEYIGVIAELSGTMLYHYCLMSEGGCDLYADVGSDMIDDRIESYGLVNLWAIAGSLAARTTKPLITLAVPSKFE